MEANSDTSKIEIIECNHKFTLNTAYDIKGQVEFIIINM